MVSQYIIMGVLIRLSRVTLGYALLINKTAFAMLPYGLTEATILTDYVYRPRLAIPFINYFYRPRLAILFSDDGYHSNQDLLLK